MDRNSTLFYIPISITSDIKDSDKQSGSENGPGEQVIKNILNFSKALQVVKAKSLNYSTDIKAVEMILN